MDHTPGQRQFRDLVQFKDYVCTKNNLPREGFKDYIEFLLGIQARLGATHEAAAVTTAKRLGAKLASHDDTTAAQVERSLANGGTLAEFPTTSEAARTCNSLGIATIMGAPNLVRGGSHSGNMAARELAEGGLLDILSSDYAPASLLLGAVQLGALWGNLARGMATVTVTPAKHVGMEDRGEIAIGKRADLCLFEIEGDSPFVSAVWANGTRVS